MNCQAAGQDFLAHHLVTGDIDPALREWRFLPQPNVSVDLARARLARPNGEVYEPRFTYHPVQYVQVDNSPCELSIEDVEVAVAKSESVSTRTR